MRIFLPLLLVTFLFSAEFEFSFHKLNGQKDGNTLLIVGGVHGDEPGGYFAPALMLKHYKIKKGNLWIVPNLNVDSIVANQRGIYGDMNRKFASITKDDKDYASVTRIKKIILDKKVDFVINLHDGIGFYREKWDSAIFNPKAWGQSYVIDQKKLSDVKFGSLDEITSLIGSKLNKELSKEHHTFSVKNTETKFKDEEMRRSLTYFSITNLKPALAIETSKNIVELNQKVFYQLKSAEALMEYMGIEFERDFELSLENVAKILKEYGTLKINNNILLDLNDIKSSVRYTPLKQQDNTFVFSHPLGVVKKDGSAYKIMIGNIEVSTLNPQYFNFNCKYKNANIEIDGVVKKIDFGSIIDVKESFKVQKDPNFRVNVIGDNPKSGGDKDEPLLKKSDFLKQYSLDKSEKTYRIEFYDDGSFCGMVGAKFLN